MAVKVSFGNIDLMSDGEGNFSFTPGFMGEDRAVIKLGQSRGLLYQELGTSGAEHYLDLRFRVVPFTTIKNRIEEACKRSESTLTVRGFTNYNNCIVMGKPQIVEAPAHAKKLSGDAGLSCFVRIVFVQLY